MRSSICGTRCARAVGALLALAAVAACGDIVASPRGTPSQTRRTESGTVELPPVVGVACGYGWTGDYPHCEPPGGWIPGGSDPGVYTTIANGGGSPTTTNVTSAEGSDGPILGLIVCLVGFGATGFTIYDVWDQTRSMLEDRSAMVAAEGRAAAYRRGMGDGSGDDAMLEVLNYEAEQARSTYNDDLHQLAEKMNLSDYTMGVSILSCATAVGAPTF